MTCRNGTHILLMAFKGGRSQCIEIPVHDLILGGWTGRNSVDLDAHIAELAALGIAAPKEMPVFYRVASSLLTTTSNVQVIGKTSTGEVEFVLFNHSDEVWVGVGSDHTDRKMEASGITLSKQLCAKPVGYEVWALSEIESHWDHLTLRSYVGPENKKELYQEEKVSTLRHPRNLIESYKKHHPTGFGHGSVMFSGTFAARGSCEWAERFSIELEDPVLGRRIKHAYHVRALMIET